MLRYPIRFGRLTHSGAKDKNPALDPMFFRAALLAICGAAAVVSFLSFSVAGSDRAVNIARADDAAIAVYNEESREIKASTNAADGSVWAYIESMLRKMIGDAG